MIDWIEKWYSSQCNGDWEHDQTIKIESLDNPGWKVKIDFNQTGIEAKNIKWRLYRRSETIWVGYSIIDNVYNSAGDPSKLNLYS